MPKSTRVIPTLPVSTPKVFPQYFTPFVVAKLNIHGRKQPACFSNPILGVKILSISCNIFIKTAHLANSFSFIYRPTRAERLNPRLFRCVIHHSSSHSGKRFQGSKHILPRFKSLFPFCDSNLRM